MMLLLLSDDGVAHSLSAVPALPGLPPLLPYISIPDDRVALHVGIACSQIIMTVSIVSTPPVLFRVSPMVPQSRYLAEPANDRARFASTGRPPHVVTATHPHLYNRSASAHISLVSPHERSRRC